MAEYSSHVPGTFSWFELATPDQAKAVAFYRSLFEWDVQDVPLGGTQVYTLFRVRGVDVAAACTQQSDERQMGIPAHWNLYIASASVDDSTARAKALGGKVLAGPFDVMDAGRMVVLQDPTGAVFHLWQANRNVGTRILGEPGTPCWTELTTTDPTAAEAFYTQLFGWTAKHGAADATVPYTEFSVAGAEAPSIGMMPKLPGMPADMPSFWMPYFMVTDCAASTERVRALGGQTMMGPHPIADVGWFSVVADPTGACFALFQAVAG